jgi:hypothetical protein
VKQARGTTVRYLVVLAMLAVAGCGGSDPAVGPRTYPSVAASWSSDGAAVSCPTAQHTVSWTETDGAHTACEWYCAEYGGAVDQYVYVEFKRPDASSAWSEWMHESIASHECG